MTFNKNWLSNFREIEGGKVILGNSDTCQVLEIGSVSVKMFDGIVRTLKDIRFAPNLTRNLISLGFLYDSGYTRSMVVIKEIKKSGLYHLVGEIIVGNIATASLVKITIPCYSIGG